MLGLLARCGTSCILPMNVSLPIAAVMLDLGFRLRRSRPSRSSPAPRGCSLFTLPEQGEPDRLRLARAAEERSSTSAEVETRPWDEQLALDGEGYRAQIAYLLELLLLPREARDFGQRPSARSRSCR